MKRMMTPTRAATAATAVVGMIGVLAVMGVSGCGEQASSPEHALPQPTPNAPAIQLVPPATVFAPPSAIPGPADAAALESTVRERIAQLQSVVQANPSSATAWMDLADTLFAHSEPAGASEAYSGALAFLPVGAPDRERVEYLRAMALESAGERADAFAALAALAPQSKTSHVHWRLGLWLAGEGRMEEALTSAGHGVACDPADARARAAVAQIASEMGDWETAAQAARDGLRIVPRNGHLYGLLAAARRASGDAAGADALTNAGRHRAADWLDPWLRELREKRVNASARRERFFEALRAAKRDVIAAELLAIESNRGAFSEAEVRLLRAHAALAANDLASAKSLLAEASATTGRDCEIALLAVLMAARESAGAEALDPLCDQLSSLQCEGDNEATRLELLASLRLAQRRWDAAAEAFVLADQARQAGIGQAFLRAASQMERERAYDAARVLAKHLVSVEPVNPQGWLLLSVIELHAGDVPAAQAAAVELATLAPNHPSTKKLLADIQAAAAAAAVSAPSSAPAAAP